jgi:hypothetical protein
MKGNLVTGPHIPIMQSLKSFIKTWFPEIPRGNVQQIFGVRHIFSNTCIESCES